MAVKIRLKRMGKIRNPFYRVVVVDAHKKRDGRVIEEIGTYNPKTEPSHIDLVSERAQYWLGVGAQPTEPAAALLRANGDLPAKTGATASGPKEAEAPRSKEDIFQAALKEMHAESEASSSKKSMSKAKTDDGAQKDSGAKPEGEKAEAGGSDSPSDAQSAGEASNKDDTAGSPETADS